MQKKYSSSVRVFYPRFSKEEVIKLIRKRLAGLRNELPVSLVVLFGSYAMEKHTAASDIDLLVLYKGEKRADDYARTKSTIDIHGLKPHVYTEDEYVGVEEVIRKMIRGGITLYTA